MKRLEVTKIFTFDSAHFLTKYHGKCENLHGHTYKLEVTVEGPLQENGMVIDFTILKNIVKNRVIKKVDHKLINDILENPSSENFVVWIWEQLQPFQKRVIEESQNPNLPEQLKRYAEDTSNMNIAINTVSLKKLRLWETPTSYVDYFG